LADSAFVDLANLCYINELIIHSFIKVYGTLFCWLASATHESICVQFNIL